MTKVQIIHQLETLIEDAESHRWDAGRCFSERHRSLDRCYHRIEGGREMTLIIIYSVGGVALLATAIILACMIVSDDTKG